MQILVRESLAELILRIPALVTSYQRGRPDFVEAVIRWLESAEQQLQKLRLPLAGFVAAKRATILATRDGLRVEHVSDDGLRKRLRATAVTVLAEVEAKLREKVSQEDARLADAIDKIAQLVAVNPITPPPKRGSRSAWLARVWRSLANGNGKGIHAYLNARLAPSDRHHLLDRVLENALKNGRPPRKRAAKRGSNPAPAPRRAAGTPEPRPEAPATSRA